MRGDAPTRRRSVVRRAHRRRASFAHSGSTQRDGPAREHESPTSRRVTADAKALQRRDRRPTRRAGPHLLHRRAAPGPSRLATGAPPRTRHTCTAPSCPPAYANVPPCNSPTLAKPPLARPSSVSWLASPVSQSRAVPSSEAVITERAPRLKDASTTASRCPASVTSSREFRASQIRAIPSPPPVTMNLPLPL